MIYDYKCGSCGVEREMYASIEEAGREYLCSCGGLLRRHYGRPSNISPHGRYPDHRRNPETGQEEICIGNEKESLKKLCEERKRERTEYNLPREAKYEIAQAVSNAG